MSQERTVWLPWNSFYAMDTLVMKTEENSIPSCDLSGFVRPDPVIISSPLSTFFSDAPSRNPIVPETQVSEKGTKRVQVTVLTWAQGHHVSSTIATANVSAELHSFWQAPGFLMGAAGVIWGLCHPDTFIFGHLAPSHYHTTYQLYLCISVVSLGVSREFYKGLACGADRRLFPYFLGQRQTLLVLFFHCCIQLGFILLVEVVCFYGISYVSLAYNLQ